MGSLEARRVARRSDELLVSSHRRSIFWWLRMDLHRFQSVSAVTGATLDIVMMFQLIAAIVIASFVAYNVFHYVLFLLVTQPKNASKIGHELNQFEQRQLIEWTPHPSDFLKHDDEKRTYDDVFGTYRGEQANYSTCVFPRVAFSRPYEAEYVLLKLKEGMRLLDLGCGSGAAAYYLASRRDIEIVCVTNSPVQADICRRKFAKLGGHG